MHGMSREGVAEWLHVEFGKWSYEMTDDEYAEALARMREDPPTLKATALVANKFEELLPTDENIARRKREAMDD